MWSSVITVVYGSLNDKLYRFRLSSRQRKSCPQIYAQSALFHRTSHPVKTDCQVATCAVQNSKGHHTNADKEEISQRGGVQKARALVCVPIPIGIDSAGALHIITGREPAACGEIASFRRCSGASFDERFLDRIILIGQDKRWLISARPDFYSLVAISPNNGGLNYRFSVENK